jgi:membrane protease YdiL (CAAX protease family)
MSVKDVADVSDHSLLRFFIVTFAVSWGCYLTAALVGRAGLAPTEMRVLGTVLLYVGTFAPAFVGLLMSVRNGTPDGALTLLGRAFRGNVPVRWYVLAIGYFPAIKLASTVIHRIAIGTWPPFGDTPWYLVAAAVAVSTPVQAGEEIGWRGYALPRLAARFGPARASLLLGVIWATWHLPLFLIPGVDNYGQSFTLFLIAVTALSVAMTWLYMRTNGSLLLVMLMHSVVDQTFLVIPSGNPTATNPFALSATLVGWSTVVLLWGGATYLLVRIRADKTAPRGTLASDGAASARSRLSLFCAPASR